MNKIMKKHNKYLFIENDINSVISDCSDGYIKGFGEDGDKRIKLPHKNYTLLGIVQETYDAPYAEDISKEIVDNCPNGEGYWNYSQEGLNGWVFQLKSAVESMKTLIEKLDLKPTDYILRDDSGDTL
jgi:hypothetical protein